jgi:hypothetical protein
MAFQLTHVRGLTTMFARWVPRMRRIEQPTRILPICPRRHQLRQQLRRLLWMQGVSIKRSLQPWPTSALPSVRLMQVDLPRRVLSAVQ